jgi:hypothetical protein
MTSEYSLFKLFAKSFTTYQDRWHQLFKGKLLIEEQHDELTKTIQNTLIDYKTKTSKVIYAVTSYFTEKSDIISSLTSLLNEDSDSIDIIKALHNVIKNPYLVGKILMLIRKDPLFADIKQDSTIMSSIAGSGGIDGAKIVVGRDKQFERSESYFHVLSIMIRQEKDEEIHALFKHDYLLLEDYLCEFHMFYRLFEPNYNDMSRESMIRLINEDLIDMIILSHYTQSDLPYDQFQKQYIQYIITKEVRQ